MQKLESLGVMAGGIAHQFNNLLTVMMGNVGLVFSHLPAESEARLLLDEVDRSAREASELCRQMLIYAGDQPSASNRIFLLDLVGEMEPLIKVTLLFRPAPSVKPSAPAASGGGFPGEGTKRVLVVDDEEAVRTILDMILKRAGYETVLAGNGLEGLRRIEAGESFGAVVLDMTMPVMDGVEAFARIRNIHPEMPVLLISGFARSPEASRLSNEPGTLFLAKPFNRDGFLNGLRALLDGKCRVPTKG